MKRKVNIDATTLRFLYIRYKEYLLPVGVIIACILLFVFVIIPQFQNLLDAQQQAKIESNKLAVLRNNLNLLTNLSEPQLDSQLKVVTKVMPPEKDFGGILNGISLAANKAGVSLGDYEFQVGNINKPALIVQAYPSLEIILTINGGIADVGRFLEELYKTAPLCEITNIKVNSSDSQVTALFFYRPFPPIGFNDTAPIETISPQGVSTINNLSTWNNIPDITQSVLVPQATPTPVASPSSTPFSNTVNQ